jgi:hypothetical protein
MPDSSNLVRGNKDGKIIIKNGESIRLECPGSVFVAMSADVVKAICQGGEKLSIGEKIYNVKDLGCKAWPERQTWTAGSCMGGRVLVKMGYLTTMGYVELFEACHDTAQHSTVYVKHVLWHEADATSKGSAHASWMNGNLFK